MSTKFIIDSNFHGYTIDVLRDGRFRAARKGGNDKNPKVADSVKVLKERIRNEMAKVAKRRAEKHSVPLSILIRGEEEYTWVTAHIRGVNRSTGKAMFVETSLNNGTKLRHRVMSDYVFPADLLTDKEREEIRELVAEKRRVTFALDALVGGRTVRLPEVAYGGRISVETEIVLMERWKNTVDRVLRYKKKGGK